MRRNKALSRTMSVPARSYSTVNILSNPVLVVVF